MEGNIILKGYMSHPIRGRKGESCSDAEMQENCTKAAQLGAHLMNLLQHAGIPTFLYVPGAHDDFVQKAYSAGRITVEEILATDCDIIKECDYLLIYDWQDYLSEGMKKEQQFAYDNDIPVITITKLDQQALWTLEMMLLDTLLSKLQEPNIIKIGDT